MLRTQLGSTLPLNLRFGFGLVYGV